MAPLRLTGDLSGSCSARMGGITLTPIAPASRPDAPVHPALRTTVASGAEAMSRRCTWCLAGGTLALASSFGWSAMAQQPDYPLRCHGAGGIASSDRNKLVVDFTPSRGSAGQGLQPGQCSWLDRALRPNEPTRIIDLRPSPGEAQITAQHINRGDIWTFWVYNAGHFLHATASAPGTPTHKPVRIDPN